MSGRQGNGRGQGIRLGLGRAGGAVAFFSASRQLMRPYSQPPTSFELDRLQHSGTSTLTLCKHAAHPRYDPGAVR